jgi:hypothetical protein
MFEQLSHFAGVYTAEKSLLLKPRQCDRGPMSYFKNRARNRPSQRTIS